MKNEQHTSSGPSVVFLPGLLCDDEVWREQADRLAGVAQVQIADLGKDDTIAAMAGRALAAAPPRFVLVALSMGGYVAFEIWRQARQGVVALALFDTSAAPDAEERSKERLATLSSLSHGRFTGVTRRLLPRLIHPGLVAGPVGERVSQMAQRVGGAVFRRQQMAILTRPDSRPMLASINVPTLVAVGDSDQLTPPDEALQIHIGIESSEFSLVRGCGQLPPLEKPAETNALLQRWLQSVHDRTATAPAPQ